MSVLDSTSAPGVAPSGALMTRSYRVVGYFGLMTVFASLIFGFRFDPTAAWW